MMMMQMMMMMMTVSGGSDDVDDTVIISYESSCQECNKLFTGHLTMLKKKTTPHTHKDALCSITRFLHKTSCVHCVPTTWKFMPNKTKRQKGLMSPMCEAFQVSQCAGTIDIPSMTPN
jgi:hypothetical protein